MYLYMDKFLSFRLWSALLLFSTVVDTLQWIMEKEGLSWMMHYIDHFLMMDEFSGMFPKHEHNGANLYGSRPANRTN